MQLQASLGGLHRELEEARAVIEDNLASFSSHASTPDTPAD